MPSRGAERGAAEQDDHRLQRERHRRERQRNADLRGGNRQHGHEQDGGGADRGGQVGARGDRLQQRAAGKRLGTGVHGSEF